VRLFNAFTVRRWRALGYLSDFSRLNRRMHNKSFTADRQVTIVGGRNIGDEYFETGNNALFIDLDIMAIGPVVGDVADDFERYWTSGSAQPATQVVRKPRAAAIAALSSVAHQLAGSPEASAYTEAITRHAFVRDLLAGQLRFEWAAVSLLSDSPNKGLGKAPDHTALWPRLQAILGDPTIEMELVSPYLVPARAGVEAFGAFVKKGVKVTLLTNSLEATDVVAVHAGYAKRRKPLLAAGVALFELKRMASIPKVRDRGLTGGSGSSLHAKVFTVDRRRVFIGSFNFDPRSQHLNTEMGFVIESPTLAGDISDRLKRLLASRAYRVQIGETGALEWVEQADSSTIVHPSEPGAGAWRRAAVTAASHVIINEAYLNGGSAGATYKNRFVELYNPTDSAINLKGWSLQYRPGGNTGAISISAALDGLSGIIPAKGYYLVKGAANGGAAPAGRDLPAADVESSSLAFAASTGTIVLSNQSAKFQALPTGSVVGEPGVVDLFGYGTSNTFEGAAGPTGSDDARPSRPW